jgi:hypothetical protein
MSARKKTRKNAGEGYGYMFHGAFKDKADAVKKERKTKGAWVKGVLTNQGHRYLVMSPRTNPIKRKKKRETVPNPHELLIMGANPHGGEEHQQEISLPPGSTILIRTPRTNPVNAEPNPLFSFHPGLLPQHVRERTLERRKRVSWDRMKPAKRRLVAIAAGVSESLADTWSRIKWRDIPDGWRDALISHLGAQRNPIFVNPGPDDNYMVQAATELFGKQLKDLSTSEMSKVAMRAAQLKQAKTQLRHNMRTRRSPKNQERLWRELGREGQQAAEPTPEQKIPTDAEIDAMWWIPKTSRSMMKRDAAKKRLRGNVELGTYENGIFHPWTRRPASRQKKAIRRQNPDAAGIREDFTGMPVEHEIVRQEPHMPAGNYAQLGKLLTLAVKPRAGGQVLDIRSNALIVSDERAQAEEGKLGPIWFVGGDQDITAALPQFGAIERRGGIYELGEAREIHYEQRKEHVPHPEQDHWRHRFGEETNVRPTVLFDLMHKRLLLEGGAYRIRREGIVN